MTVTPLGPPILAEPDAPLPVRASPAGEDFAGALGRALNDAGSAFARAAQAERAFETGRGGLQELTVERAQADIALALAATTASRTVQALSTILGMQV